MKFCQVSTFLLAIALSHLTYAAPATTNSVLGSSEAKGIIKNQYIVILNKDVGSSNEFAQGIAKQHGGKVLQTYDAVLKGFAIYLPDVAGTAFVEAMKKNPKVVSIENDTIMKVDATTQSNPDWGLDRIDQRNLPLDSAYSYLQTGSGTTAYIVDTGILSTHQQFSGRVLSGYTAISDGNGTSDCHGHGTHVAGTVGGSTYGVAKNVSLVPIRILGCDGSGASSNVIAGLDWILKNGKKPAVVNISLGGEANASLDSAVENLFNNGYVMVVAAGNSNTDACSSSPARVSKAITVAATDNTDTRASYSNYGSCVDIFAPGSQINSSWIGSNTATKVLNGTSMATPHVVGVVAEMLQSTPTATPQTISTNLLNQASSNVVKNPSGSPNRLLYKSP
ncbi:S8 family peptidase [Acinetobacter pittii]|jgi:subtilisin family serine protease|uniref:S8 family peptidase n=1 Tax=Acinetobacter pittii TaxID=48296 RepID=A0AAE9MCD8_ACIPI|nr:MULTISPECIES: S8 family peptidase [Acinetobacter calcoaceticus/baumannii complex]AZP29186.1 S8 family peptidase [Acinetobacter pittii]EXC29233.1 extracellular serine proteinase [Acinetobacter sp. 809848]EXE28746.1 extracellular serine proteinase [Acinetobacter sp. 907131]EXS13398.1 extracellular serine proteinase [Acinetobacter sp. 883425]MBK0412450.1 S8 family peptidase [Acinetobacter pittii]